MKRLVLVLLFTVNGFSLNANEFIHVVTEELRPLNYLENNEVKGRSTAIVRQVLKEADLESSFQVFPWARSFAMAQNKKNTLIYTINRTPEREQKFKWIGLLDFNHYHSFLFKLKANDKVKITNLEDAKSYVIGAQLGDVNYELLKSEGFKHIQAVPERSQTVKMLLRNRVDLVVGSYAILNEEFNKVGAEFELIEPLIPFKTSNPYMAISNQTSDELVNKIKAAYQRLVLRGDIPSFETRVAALK